MMAGLAPGIEEKFEVILKSTVDLPPDFRITPNQELEADLGVDSLAMIDLVFAIEAEFGVELSEDSVVRARTTGALWSDIVRALAE